MTEQLHYITKMLKIFDVIYTYEIFMKSRHKGAVKKLQNPHNLYLANCEKQHSFTITMLTFCLGILEMKLFSHNAMKILYVIILGYSIRL